MSNKVGFLFLLFIGIVYAQFNISGTWTLMSYFPPLSYGLCCPLTSTPSQYTQPANFTAATNFSVNFGTGTRCKSVAGSQIIFLGGGPFFGLIGPVSGLGSTGNNSVGGATLYYPHNNTLVLMFQGCDYTFTQSNSKNTATTSYSFNTTYKLSSTWSPLSRLHDSSSYNISSWCCLPIDNTITVTSSNGQVSLGANYGTSNILCKGYNMTGQVNTPYVSSIGGGFMASPYTVSYFSANNTLLLSYGFCMAYYSSMSNILAIGFSLFVGLLVV